MLNSVIQWQVHPIPEMLMLIENPEIGEKVKPVEQHILCVDDDRDFLKSLEFFLPENINKEAVSEYWYRFLFVDNPKEAIELLKDLRTANETVAMVISDQKMPQMKGTELLEEAGKITPDTIRVLLTGYAGLESAITAINNHLLDKYLTKPIEDQQDFTISIRHLLQKYHMQKTIAEQNKIIQNLYSFSNVLNSIEDFQKTLDYIISFTTDTLKCERASIMLSEGNTLKIVSAKGIPDEVIRSTAVSLGDRVSGEVILSKKAILARSLDEIPYLDGKVRSEANSFISIPILLAGIVSAEQSLGVLNVTNKIDNLPFTEVDLETLTYISNTASIAIHNHINRLNLEKAHLESKTHASALSYQMTHDALTNLPNRTLFRDQLILTLSNNGHRQNKLCLLILDLNNFAEVNDTLGHHNGDILLQIIGERIQGIIEQPGIVARLGGDEFAICIPNIGLDELQHIVDEIVKAVGQPVLLEGISLEMGVNIGIALYPDHGEDAGLLLQRADVALSNARKEKETSKVYNENVDPYNIRRLTILSELRHAMENEQLLLHFQPKICLNRKGISGVETLVRWNHPQYGLIPPDQFIQLAEQTGLIKDITRWVLYNALRQCSIWQESGVTIQMAVNLSARNLQEKELPSYISGLLQKFGLDPDLLKLEITESTVMINHNLSNEVLTRLSEIGIKHSIDDFGTGHSSLAYIKNLPVNEIKVDKSFIMNITNSTDDIHIVQAAIELGHKLGLNVVAEGVENGETLEILERIGCDEIQGYFIARPMTAQDFIKWFKAYDWTRF